MTGYGLASCQFDDYRITAELKTVNNRYLDTNVRVYKQYSFVEELVREMRRLLSSAGDEPPRKRCVVL